MFRNKYLLLLIILLLALVLRVFNLSSMPPSLNWDEISHGYNAYSVLQTGSDEWGESFPLFNFRAYGDYPLPLTMYLTIPFIKVLGLTAFSIRLPQAIIGVLTVLASYFLSLGLTKRKDISLLAAFLVAIDPWHLFTSRFVLQSNIAVLLLTSSVATFLFREKNKYFLPISLVGLFLTLFSYHSTRIFTPLLLVSILLIYRKAIVTKLTLALFLLIFITVPIIFLNPAARARSNEVFLLNPNMVYSIEVLRNESPLPPLIKKAIYNRPVYLVQNFAKNYVEYFSPSFLFINGGTQYQFSVPMQGLLYIVSLPFFYFGLFKSLTLIFRRKISRDNLLLHAWLFLAPIPASLTTEHFAVVRSTTLLPLPEFFVAYGFFTAIALLRKNLQKYKKLLIVAFIVAQLSCLVFYLSKYFGSYKVDYAWAWQYGYEQVVEFSKANYEKYDSIIVTKKYGEPHEYFLFMWPWSPTKYKSDPNLVRFNQSNWWWVDMFDKFVFMNDWEIPSEGYQFKTESKHLVDCLGKRCLLITSPSNAPKNWKKVNTVYFLNSNPAFEMYEN